MNTYALQRAWVLSLGTCTPGIHLPIESGSFTVHRKKINFET